MFINHIIEKLSKSCNEPDDVHFIGTLLVGSILADGEIHESELEWWHSFKIHFSNYTDIIEKLEFLLNNETPVKLDNIKIPIVDPITQIAFEMILNICACDMDLHMNEIYFINQSAHILGIEGNEVKKYLKEIGYKVKREVFDAFCEELPEPVLKRMDKAITHIANEYNTDSKAFNDVISAIEYSLANNPPKESPKLDEDPHETLITFLLEGSHQRGSWNEDTEKAILALSKYLGINIRQFEWFKQNAKTSYQLLTQ